MLVGKHNLEDAIADILASRRISLDTETTGLNAYKGDKVFSLIIFADKTQEGYYFNFNKNPDHLGDVITDNYLLDYKDLDIIFKSLYLFERVYIHNAKFDMHMIAESMGYVEELLKANIYCTEALARLVNNDLFSYSLDALGKLIGYEKDDRVKKYISEHKLYTLVDVGKKEPRKDLHYDLVPFEIISEYGITDAVVGFKLGEHIVNRLEQYNFEQLESGYKGNADLIKTELELTKVLFKMERVGVKIDRAYSSSALEFYKAKIIIAQCEFKKLTGVDFVDSRKVLKPAFDKLGLSYPTTAKGNASFKADALDKIDNPIANIIKDYRGAYKNAYTYYKNFLDLSDDNYVLHTNLRQGGTATGRMSCREPNLQNVPKRADKGEYKARAAFVPREGYFFAMVDYDQMEYRLFMDYAEEMELIKKVLDGLDVHTATADMVSIDRDSAKTVNFSLLYGSGDKALAENLGIPFSEGKDLKFKYFQNLQEVKKTTRNIVSTAENRGYIFNIHGRRCFIPRKLCYKAPNYLIQGGCGDIVKKAMVDIDKFLDDKKSRMILQIHDEILYEVAYDEYDIIDKLRDIMVNAYNYTHLPLTAGADYSFKSWYAKEGVDYGKIANYIKSNNASEGA